MPIRSPEERLKQLRERERQLICRRRELEAIVARSAEKRALRGTIVIGEAALAAMRSNAALAAVLPQRLLPFVSERDRPAALEAFEASTPKGATPT